MISEQLLKPLEITIGDIGISLIANNRFKIDENFTLFLNQGHPEITLYIHYGSIPKIEVEERIFDSQIWNLYRSSRGKVVLRILCPQVGSSSIGRLGVFQADFTAGDMYVEMEEFQTNFPLRYPFGELLMISLLSQGRGVLIHSCGIDNNGAGVLFIGSSGAGKSTIASLVTNRKGIKVLSDDRLIIRKLNGHFWMYGTPWHGDVKICSPDRAPLERILFLRHAENNSIKKISPSEAMSRLIVCSFPTLWDKKGMEFTLEFCAELAQRIPCYELGFVPDESILDFVRGKI
jgi:hypothetical protein